MQKKTNNEVTLKLEGIMMFFFYNLGSQVIAAKTSIWTYHDISGFSVDKKNLRYLGIPGDSMRDIFFLTRCLEVTEVTF